MAWENQVCYGIKYLMQSFKTLTSLHNIISYLLITTILPSIQYYLNIGLRGDCGHRISQLAVANIYNKTLTVTSACPVINHMICSGNGNQPITDLQVHSAMIVNTLEHLPETFTIR